MGMNYILKVPVTVYNEDFTIAEEPKILEIPIKAKDPEDARRILARKMIFNEDPSPAENPRVTLTAEHDKILTTVVREVIKAKEHLQLASLAVPSSNKGMPYDVTVFIEIARGALKSMNRVADDLASRGFNLTASILSNYEKILRDV